MARCRLTIGEVASELLKPEKDIDWNIVKTWGWESPKSLLVAAQQGRKTLEMLSVCGTKLTDFDAAYNEVCTVSTEDLIPGCREMC